MKQKDLKKILSVLPYFIDEVIVVDNDPMTIPLK